MMTLRPSAAVFLVLWLAIVAWLISTVLAKREEVPRPSAQVLVQTLGQLPVIRGAAPVGEPHTVNKNGVVGASQDYRIERSMSLVARRYTAVLENAGWSPVHEYNARRSPDSTKFCKDGLSLFVGRNRESSEGTSFGVSLYWAKLENHSLYCPLTAPP